MRTTQGYELKVRGRKGDALGYLMFPSHPGRGAIGVAGRQVRLFDLVGAYQGPDIIINFDKHNRLIGIEIVE